MLVTPLTKIIGYDLASKVALNAYNKDKIESQNVNCNQFLKNSHNQTRAQNYSAL